MENVSTRFGFRSSWLDEKDPFYPCNRVGSAHRRSCYVRAPTWILEVEKNDFARTAERCVTIGGTWAPVCFRGFGRDAVVEARYRDFRRVRQLCGLAGAYEGECYYGAARTFADGEGVAGIRRAASFCAGSLAARRSSCAAGVGIVVGLVFGTPNARRRDCAQWLGAHARACAESAEAEVDPSGRGAWG
jgi:hypothetical protein